MGPGVDVTTDVSAIGSKTFALTLVDGKYSFICDAHPTTMAGSFTVGAPPAEPTPTPKPTPMPKPAATTKLVLTVTGKAVTLTTPGGARVKTVKVGPAAITVRDRSGTRGVRLRGAGVNKVTGIGFVGTQTWTVRLTAGGLTATTVGASPRSSSRACRRGVSRNVRPERTLQDTHSFFSSAATSPLRATASCRPRARPAPGSRPGRCPRAP